MRAMRQLKSALIVIGMMTMVSCRDEDKDVKVKEAAVTGGITTDANYTAAVAARDSMERAFNQTMDEISNNLAEIREKEKLLDKPGRGAEKYSPSRKQEILNTLASINDLLEENRNKMKKLNARLARFSKSETHWKKLTDSLRVTLDDQSREIALLRDRLVSETTNSEQLTKNLDEAKKSNVALTETSNKMDIELNKAWYVIGTPKELREKNVVEKEGGVFGLASVAKLKVDFDKNKFTEIDRRQMTSLEVKGKKPKLVTTHPLGSFEFEKQSDELSVLKIKDPERFWSASKYLVVQVK
jgi:hypothetical protein